MNATATLRAFDRQRYLNLESYRANGKAVRTPVWFAIGPQAEPNIPQPGTRKATTTGTTVGAAIYVYTTADSGKVKRVRRTAAVRIAPCDWRGHVTGEWLSACASIVEGGEFARGMRLLDRKYWPWKRALDLGVRLLSRHRRAMLVIRPD